MFKYFLILLLFTATNCLIPQNLNSLFDDFINNYYINKRVPSVSAGISLNGNILWSSTKGYSDLENSVPANYNTLYRIASISKSITAVAVMQLVESGKINLDEDVKKYISYIPSRHKKFTVRQLLNHTSGVRTYHENEFDSKTHFSSTKDVVLYILKDSLQYTPGSKFLYSTLGYNLLAAVIENVSGMTYSEYMKKYIFNPSGMINTMPDFQQSLIFNRARGYTRNTYREIMNAPLADLSIKYAGGGILSTSEDILRFAQKLISSELIKSETLDSMLVPSRLSNGQYVNYGLGFSFQTDEQGKKFFSHSGSGTGFTSNLIIYPTDKIAATYVTNIRDRNLDDPARSLISILNGMNGTNVKKSLADRFMDEYYLFSVDSIMVLYDKIVKDSGSTYNYSSDELNNFGKDLIGINRLIDAIKYYKFIISLYPDNADLYSGLADAYYADRNKGLALKNYRIAKKLDPGNKYISDMIKKLK
jgi:serine beta-lactamase-like protein LACTB, mitochondrial